MKKIIFLFSFIFVSVLTYAQTNVRMRAESIGFWTLDSDTMQVLSSDNVVAASIAIPEGETDSVTVSGCTFTVDGIPTNGIIIPPGEASINLNFKYAKLDTLSIKSPGKSWLIMLIDND